MSTITKKIGELFREMASFEVSRRLKETTDVVLLNYSKLSSAEMTQLRKSLKVVGASVLVTKNSYMRRVFEQANKSTDVVKMIDGPTALVFVKDDPVTISKILIGFAKEHEALGIKGGFLSDRVLLPEEIKFLSTLPSKQAVYQQIAGTLIAPVGKLAMGLNQIVTKLLYGLKAVSDKKK